MGIKTPYLAVDGIIQLFDREDKFRGIVLIERKNPPRDPRFHTVSVTFVCKAYGTPKAKCKNF